MPKTRDKEKERRRIIGITKQLREQKGIVISKKEVDKDLQNLKNAQHELDAMVQPDSTPAFKREVKESKGKLQDVIDEINLYMGIVYPEGLIDLGGDEMGSSISVSG